MSKADNLKRDIALLELHKLNIQECMTFEAFKDLQCKFLDLLIADQRNKLGEELKDD